MGILAETREADDEAWASRNEFWRTRNPVVARPSGGRKRRPQPLILCGHGVHLKVYKGTLLIRDGFTHWPQERVEYRFFKGAQDLPPRIVMLDGSGSLSFDVMRWLSEQGIPLIQLDYTGNVISVIGGAGFAIDPAKVQWQIDTRNDPDRRLEFCCQLISEKLSSSIRTLTDVIPDSKARTVAVSRCEVGLTKLSQGAVGTVEDVRMIEAAAAAAYFNAWKGLPLKWRSRWKYPVPDDWMTIGPRGTAGKGYVPTNRNAKHPVNAILNYAYGMLSSQVHIEAVASGYDPRRGVMHHDRDDADAFAWVFDMIEPRRAIVDAAVLNFVIETPLSGADFV